MIVGTPGRILDLVNEGACDLGGVEYLVLDEADRMLDKGFENDIRAIIGHAKQGEERQTLMCKFASETLIHPFVHFWFFIWIGTDVVGLMQLVRRGLMQLGSLLHRSCETRHG